MSESLVVAGRIELLGGGVPSTIPECAGAIFRLAPGFDLSAPQPTSTIVAKVLDGSYPIPGPADNRTPVLPVTIRVPPSGNLDSDRATLAAAREVLIRTVSVDTFTLIWTREGAAPLVLDCYSALPTVVDYSILRDKALISNLTISFEADPFGRSDVPAIINLQAPLPGQPPGPAPVTVDSYATVPGNWLGGQNSTFEGGIGTWTTGSNCTGAVTALQAHGGINSMLVSSSAAGNMSRSHAPFGSYALGGMPVRQGAAVLSSAWFRAAVSPRACQAGVAFFDALGNNLGETFGATVNDTTTGWVQATYSVPVPAGAVWAIAAVQVQSTAGAAEVHYVDDCSLGFTWVPVVTGPGGTSAHWDPTLWGQPDGQGIAPAYAAQGLSINLEAGWQAQATAGGTGSSFVTSAAQAGPPNPGDTFQRAPNFLGLAASGSTQNSGFEGGVGTWVQAGNTTVAAFSGGSPHTGTGTLQMTSLAAGQVAAQHTSSVNYATNGLAVRPGQSVYASAWFRASTISRQCSMTVQFLDASGNNLGYFNFPVSPVANSTSAWVQFNPGNVPVAAPAGAAWAIAACAAAGTAGVGEIHYIDDVALGVVGAQIFTITSIDPPAGGSQTVRYTPAGATTTAWDVFVQCGPNPALGALTVWAGFGSTAYFADWGLKGAGPVTFAVTLIDSFGNELSFSYAHQVVVSNDASNPSWQKIRIPVPQVPWFSFSSVAGYLISASSRFAGDLPFTDLYLSQLQAVALTNLAPVNPGAGAVYDLAGADGSARAAVSVQLGQAGTQTVTKILRGPGGGQFLNPPLATTLDVTPIGSGGGGGNGLSAAPGGASSGSSAHNAALPVTPGKVSTWYAGRGGQPGTVAHPAGFDGEDSTFTSDLGVTVDAPHGFGSPGAASNAAGAAPAAGTGGFAGAAGGLGQASSTNSGGGASSAGTAAAGNPGQAGSAGSAGGVAVTNGGKGGRGSRATSQTAQAGSVPGGGAGGGEIALGVGPGKGGDGEIIVKYTTALGMKSWLAHKPGRYATDTLCPFCPLDITDLPDGTTEYPVPSLVHGQNARFGGTYSILLVNQTWNNPTAARTVTVTVNHYEQAGGTVYAIPVVRTLTPSTLTGPDAGPIIRLGELTLPDHAIPPGQTNSYFTVTVTDTNTADRFQDCLFIDTLGSTVMVQAPAPYNLYWVDEPLSDKSVGNIMGSQFDRADAVSVLAYAWLSGPPLFVDPLATSQLIMLYCADPGAVAPAGQLIYSPRWMIDRLS